MTFKEMRDGLNSGSYGHAGAKIHFRDNLVSAFILAGWTEAEARKRMELAWSAGLPYGYSAVLDEAEKLVKRAQEAEGKTTFPAMRDEVGSEGYYSDAPDQFPLDLLKACCDYGLTKEEAENVVSQAWEHRTPHTGFLEALDNAEKMVQEAKAKKEEPEATPTKVTHKDDSQHPMWTAFNEYAKANLDTILPARQRAYHKAMSELANAISNVVQLVGEE